MSNDILAPIFERRLSLDGAGGDFESRAMSVWERMADTLDQIAANTRRSGLGHSVTASVSRKREPERKPATSTSEMARSGRVSTPGSARTAGSRTGDNATLTPSAVAKAVVARIAHGHESDGVDRGGQRTTAVTVGGVKDAARAGRASPHGGRQSVSTVPATVTPVTTTKSQQANAAGRDERAAERQGNIIADAVMGGLGKLGDWGKAGVDAVKEDSDARDAAGYAVAGPLYGVAKELQQVLPDSMKERLEGMKEGRKDESGKKRDSRGRFIPDRNTTRRETTQIEIAEDELALQEREAKAEEKRHKELVRAIRTSGRKGLLDRFAEGRRGRDRIIRERGGMGRSRDIDIGRGGARPRASTRGAGRRGLLGRLGRLGRTGGTAAGTIASGGGLWGGAGRIVAGAGRATAGAGRGMLALGAKGTLGAAKAIPIAGQILAAGMALYDGFQGWNDTEMQREAFGLAEGQEATPGQKASTAIANALDMGGLGTGLLGLLGVDMDTADIARNIYGFGEAIATAGSDFAASFGEKASAIWGGLTDMGSRIWSGAQEIGGAIAGFAGDTLEKGKSLLTGIWDGATGFLENVWGNITDFAQAGIAGAGSMLSGLWESASELPGKIADKATELATSVVEGGGKLLSTGKEILSNGAAWVGEKADSAWEEAKDMASSGWDTVKGWGSSLLDAFKPSEAHAAELPRDQEKQRKLLEGSASASFDTQEKMNEAMSSVDEAMQEQNKLLSNISKELGSIMPDTYGIAGALGGVRDAIRNVRTGGNGGYVRTGASGNSPGFAYNPDSRLGDTIAHEESGTDGVRAIGYDRNGGTSYGKWQLSSKQGGLEEWLRLLESRGGESAEIAKRLRASGPTNTGSKSGAFVDAYLKEASANAELFESTQRESLLKHNYNPAISRLQSDSLKKMIEGDKSLQEMMFSTAVQHGGSGAARIFNGVYREGMSREDLIRAVYAKRGGQFGASTAQVQQSALNRMDLERDLILGMNRGEANVRTLRERMTKGGNEAVEAGVSSMVAEATQDAMNRGVKYNMGSKHSSSGQIDCSGWVQEMTNQTMAEMNAAMGEEVFSAEARRAFNRGANQEGAAGIIRAVSEQTGQLYTNEQLAPEMAKEGMVIGLDTGRHGWEAGRFKDIDHVVQTYRDPTTGELMVSESRGGKGVMSSRYADWYAEQQRRGTKLYGAEITAMADASRVAPVQPTVLADAAASQGNTPASAIAEAQSVSTGMEQGNPSALADSAMPTAVPASTAQIMKAEARSTRKADAPEAVRTILPPQDMNNEGRGDTALLAMLGKILAAIEAGNRKAGSMAAGGGDGAPSISMDYDDPAVRGMAQDMA